MAGYLGKISAIVTVNTSDIASKIQSGFAAPFEKSLRQIESTLRSTNSSILKSFDDIYTTGQKRARAMAAAQMGAVKGYNGDQFSKQIRAAEDIAKPIARLAAEVEKTSGAVRSQFEPALVAVQADAQKLFDQMRRGAAVSAQEIGTVVGKVESLSAAFDNAANANARMAAGWKNMDAAGAKSAEKQRIAGMFAAAGRQAMDLKLGADDSRAPMAARQALLEKNAAEAAGKRRAAEMFATLGQKSREALSPANTGVLPPGYLQGVVNRSRSERERSLFGDAVGSASRDAGNLKSKIVDLQGTIDKLPAPIRAKMIPALTQVRQLFMSLGPNATAADIAKAAAAASALEQRVSRVNDALKFKGSFSAFLDSSSVRRYESQLESVQSTMAAIGVTAKGPVASAINTFRAELAKAAMTGQLGTDVTREKMQQLVQAIGDAAVASGKMTKAQSQAFVGGVMRSGDISRMGFDKLNLAIQQAGFAIDDFFSVTGGLDMRLRAVGNNVTQLAFILDKSRGLYLALAAVVGIQLFLMFRKFSGATDEAKRKEEELKKTTENLNSSLEKQLSIAESLAKTYRDLGREIVQATATEAEATRAAAKNRADDIRDDQRNGRRQMFLRSPLGAEANLAESFLAKQFEEESDMARRVVVGDRLNRARSLTQARFAGLEAGARDIASQMAPDAIRGRIEDLNRQQLLNANLYNEVRNTPNFSERTDTELSRLYLAMKSVNEQLAAFEMALQIAGDDAKALGVESFGVLQEKIKQAQSDLAGLGEDADASPLQARLGGIGRRMAAALAGAGTPEEMQARVAEMTAQAAGVLADSRAFIAEEKKAADARQEAAKRAEEWQRELDRGMELIASPQQKAAETFRKDLAAAGIAAQFAVMANAGGRAAAINQFIKGRAAEVAPMLAGFAAERETALLMGAENRAALNASDVSTGEGQRELNRLLRGEDASKDVNLSELKQQTELLGQLVEIALKEQNVVVDF